MTLRARGLVAVLGLTLAADLLAGAPADAARPTSGSAPVATARPSEPASGTHPATTARTASTVRAAAYVPRLALPRRSGSGRRIVYSERLPQHIWLVDAHGAVVRDFAASGRADWPRAGTYRVRSKSSRSWSTTYGVSFRWMVRFTYGHHAWIGFHTIPRYSSGRLMHPVSQLGKPVGRGGCPHSADANAKFLYHWAGLGTKVVVLH